MGSSLNLDQKTFVTVIGEILLAPAIQKVSNCFNAIYSLMGKMNHAISLPTASAAPITKAEQIDLLVKQKKQVEEELIIKQKECESLARQIAHEKQQAFLAADIYSTSLILHEQATQKLDRLLQAQQDASLSVYESNNSVLAQIVTVKHHSNNMAFFPICSRGLNLL